MIIRVCIPGIIVLKEQIPKLPGIHDPLRQLIHILDLRVQKSRNIITVRLQLALGIAAEFTSHNVIQKEQKYRAKGKDQDRIPQK